MCPPYLLYPVRLYPLVWRRANDRVRAWQRGALVIDVNEAYTSKTRSWDGTVNTRLGGTRVIRDGSGFGMYRDVNGTRGVFLRALGDRPFLRGLLTQDALQPTATSANVV